jgi:hypothetical protein
MSELYRPQTGDKIIFDAATADILGSDYLVVVNVFAPTASTPGFCLTRYDDGRLSLADDATGRAISTTLVERVREAGNIAVFEHRIAVDLITSAKTGLPGPTRVLGAYVLDKETGEFRGDRECMDTDHVGRILARRGGCSSPSTLPRSSCSLA